MGEPNLKTKKSFKVGFEGEYEFVGHYITPQYHRGTTIQALSNDRVVDGRLSHKAWIDGTNVVIPGENTNHRGYPTLQMEKTPLGIVQGIALVDLYMWVDVPLVDEEFKNWFSIATFTSYYDNYWSRTYLVNMDPEYRIHLMHVPVQGVAEADIYQSKTIIVPHKSWVRVTILIDYTTNNRFDSPIMAAWQNGELVSASRFSNRIDPHSTDAQRPDCLDDWDGVDAASAEAVCELNFTGGMAQTHFGLYLPPSLSSGLVYNDNLTMCELERT